MDLALYARVLLRHKVLLLLGLLVAVGLAILSYDRVGLDGGKPTLTPRKAELWQSQATVLLTEPGFPAGRRVLDSATKLVGGQVVAVPKFNAPGSYAGVVALYARLAESDQVRRRIEKSGPLAGSFQALATSDPLSPERLLPMVTLFGKASSPQVAQETVRRGMKGFLSYVRREQVAAGIPKRNRIEFQVINAPEPAILVAPRKRTLPIVVFLSVMIAAIALAFVLENSMRRRSVSVEVLELEPEREADADAAAEPDRSIRRWA